MWKNIDTSDLSFNTFDIQIDKLNTDNDTQLFFSSDDHANSAKNFSCNDSHQNSFSNIDTQSLFGDDPLGFYKEESNKSIFSNDEFDLIGSIKDSHRLNEFIPNLNNNNNNSCFQNVPLKTSKRGRGRGSRGSYKPRGSNRARMVNQNSNFVPCSFNNPIQNCAYSYNTRFNLNNPSSFISQSSMSNSHQTVCINPEILRRLGYQQQVNSNDSNSSLMLNIKNQSMSSINPINEYGFLCNQFNETAQINSQIYENNCNETNYEEAFSSNNPKSSLANDLSFDLFKSNCEETNYFGDLDSKCYMDISNKEHLVVNGEEYENTYLTEDSNLDSFF